MCSDDPRVCAATGLQAEDCVYDRARGSVRVPASLLLGIDPPVRVEGRRGPTELVLETDINLFLHHQAKTQSFNEQRKK